MRQGVFVGQLSDCDLLTKSFCSPVIICFFWRVTWNSLVSRNEKLRGSWVRICYQVTEVYRRFS